MILCWIRQADGSIHLGCVRDTVTLGICPHYLFRSLTIMSLLTYAVSVWGCAGYSAYLCKTDKLQDRAVRFEYLKYTTPIKDLIKQSDARPWADIYSHNEYPLDCLSPLRGMEFWRKGGTLTSYPKLRIRVFKPYFQTDVHLIVNGDCTQFLHISDSIKNVYF